MMRAIVGALALVTLLAGMAVCDTIGVYSDNMGANCNIVDNTQTLLAIYVVHISNTGAIAAQFSAPKPACMVGAIWLSDTVAFFEIGNTQVGTSIPYGTCRTGPTHAVTMNYFAKGTSEPCCHYPVLADPSVAEGRVLVEDCDFNTVAGTGLWGTVNGNATCPCGSPVPAEETSWGRVKALYLE